MTLGSALFQKKKQKSGDIRPRNILIDDKGCIGIVNCLSFPDELTNYYKSLSRKERTYLAPEELAELEVKVKYMCHNTIKEVSVVRDDQKGTFMTFELILKP